MGPGEDQHCEANCMFVQGYLLGNFFLQWEYPLQIHSTLRLRAGCRHHPAVYRVKAGKVSLLPGLGKICSSIAPRPSNGPSEAQSVVSGWDKG